VRDYIEIGSSPAAEDCAQVGDENYNEQSRVECRRFVELLTKTFGEPPAGAEFGIKNFSHDFGGYREVVVYFDDNYPDSVDFAYQVEANSPQTWEG
jgi:hypothetical protein